jgi:NAD(P)H-dependent flavin oxidoreductase YrpB (nitropropane dioxygenase family)
MRRLRVSDPVIIQGGMGIGVSNWNLAREVARHGGLGVVSGTAINSLFVRRLQSGDINGDMRRALSRFPFPKISKQILEKYFVPGGISGAPSAANGTRNATIKRSPMFSLVRNAELEALTVAANFAEVYLAKEGHSGQVGINYLEKIQLPHLPSIYGAMLAGVDYVLMGAGIPRDIPGILDLFSHKEPASLKIYVEGAEAGTYKTHFDPSAFEQENAASQNQPTQFSKLKRPKFLAIVSSAILAKSLQTKASGKIDGFVVETPTAGGHNAPPRGKMQLNEKGEPIYGAKDEVDLKEMLALNTPFWLAGSYGNPEGLAKAIAVGAAGIQVGTAFAYAAESGLTEKLRQAVWTNVSDPKKSDIKFVYTDALASPTGMPFKVVLTEDTLSDSALYEARPRKCDLGFLRDPVQMSDGKLAYRCASEPIEAYVKKGGLREAAQGRKCLCNALMASVGHPQVQENGYIEAPLITSGDDLNVMKRLMLNRATWYTAADVLEFLVSLSVEASARHARVQEACSTF